MLGSYPTGSQQQEDFRVRRVAGNVQRTSGECESVMLSGPVRSALFQPAVGQLEQMIIRPRLRRKKELGTVCKTVPRNDHRHHETLG